MIKLLTILKEFKEGTNIQYKENCISFEFYIYKINSECCSECRWNIENRTGRRRIFNENENSLGGK